ncbi:MAG TPA: hypothetical protein PLV05_10540 [Verrucomicrobiota bacterium]|nr:hypothetical protein [Verrucomicrobiota bacterium]HRR65109.1 hypothetical protein [Candidatus Paceibacterota bacterium]HNR71106.1 hypothetical protein [Verrucomicrobiota bacterium]HOF71273.1 hypothetical protein [Verrucomicrobiota bacterium]HOM45812.1 hypothetical protein [Verrucomicrobiota bacterium]
MKSNSFDRTLRVIGLCFCVFIVAPAFSARQSRSEPSAEKRGQARFVAARQEDLARIATRLAKGTLLW